MFDMASRARPWRLAAAAVCVALCGSASAADKELLDILLANGAINKAQYDKLLAKEEIAKEDIEEVVATINSKGLNVKRTDGSYAFRLGTRLHADTSFHTNEPDRFNPVNGTELRRARIEAKGTFATSWNWAAQIDFADNKTSVKDMWLGYKTDAGTKLFFGNQKQPSSLSLEMSSNDIPFIERGIDNFLVAPFGDRAIGFRAERSGANWFLAGGLFGDSVSPSSESGNEGWGASARAVFAPVLEPDRVVHLGGYVMARNLMANPPTLRIRDETTHLSNLRVINQRFTAVDDSRLFGLEGAVAVGPFSIVGEYHGLNLARDVESNLDFSGYNVYATWSLTGESRASGYKISSGEFKRLKPDAEFAPGSGDWGAFELALRYANLDLNDGDFVGGEESVLTSALNWYLNSHVRLMLEWSRIVDVGEGGLQDAEDINIFQFRTQYTF